jgi:hypothetical protein
MMMSNAVSGPYLEKLKLMEAFDYVDKPVKRLGNGSGDKIPHEKIGLLSFLCNLPTILPL